MRPGILIYQFAQQVACRVLGPDGIWINKRYFKAGRALFIVVILFNIIDLPLMLAKGDMLKPLEQNHFILPSFILFQILVTWYFVWRYSRKTRTN